MGEGAQKECQEAAEGILGSFFSPTPNKLAERGSLLCSGGERGRKVSCLFLSVGGKEP